VAGIPQKLGEGLTSCLLIVFLGFATQVY
jgi:hypothetical protein